MIIRIALLFTPLTVLYLILLLGEHAYFWRRRKKTKTPIALFLSSATVLLLFQYATSIYAYPLAILPSVVLVVATIRVVLTKPDPDRVVRMSTVRQLSYIACAALCMFALTKEYDGTPRQAEGVELAFPLLNGGRVVFRGGSTLWFNHHRAVPEQKWAIDVGRPLGVSEMTGMVTGNLQKFKVYGELVHAPCSGKVVTAVDGIPNEPLGHLNSRDVAGNHVVLACQSSPPVKVRLAHLIPGSLKVACGEYLQLGAPIGRVGNSGNTSMPHLHMDAVDDAGAAVPIFFGGRFYRAYDTFGDESASAWPVKPKITASSEPDRLHSI
jgi:hypothetical protein